jgi:hypothetical protein
VIRLGSMTRLTHLHLCLSVGLECRAPADGELALCTELGAAARTMRGLRHLALEIDTMTDAAAIALAAAAGGRAALTHLSLCGALRDACGCAAAVARQLAHLPHLEELVVAVLSGEHLHH